MERKADSQSQQNEKRKLNLQLKYFKREIQQGKIKNGRNGIIKVPKHFDHISDYERWLHQEVCLKPAEVPREYVGIFSSYEKYLRYFRIDPNRETGKLEWQFTSDIDKFIRGKIVTHNHPSGNTFSYNEVVTCADLEFQEFRVVTKEYIYSLKPREEGWPSHESIKEELGKCLSQNGETRDRCYELLAERKFFDYEKILYAL